MKQLYDAFIDWFYLPAGKDARPYNILFFGVLALSAVVIPISIIHTLAMLIN